MPASTLPSVGLEIQSPWTTLILDGEKTIETRNYELPASLIGVDIAIVESPPGAAGVSSLGDAPKLGAARIVGTVVFERCFRYASVEQWHADEPRHRVARDSPYTWAGDGDKYGWVVGRCTPVLAVPTPPMRRKLRSLFEFQRGPAETAQTAKACFAAGDYEQAEALFSILLQDEAAADRLAHYCNRSACRLKLGRHDDAAADARVALEISPDSVKAHFRLASALVERAQRCSGAEGSGRRAEAAAACSAALALHPGHAQLLALAARCAEEESAPAAASAPAESAAPPAPTAGDGDNGGVAEEDYAEWCRQTANRLYGEGEFGQAVAWYGHALSALGASSTAAPPPQTPAADGTGDADDGDAAAAVTLLSNRAAAALKLGRWADAAADARAARATLARSRRVRGSAALLRWERCRRLLRSRPPPSPPPPADDDGGARRLSELRALPAKELRQERELRRELDGSATKARRASGTCPAAAAAARRSRRRFGRKRRRQRCAREGRAGCGGGGGGARGGGGGRGGVAGKAGGARGGGDDIRVGEVGEMARRGEWDGALEHASWLAREYPQHAVLRRLRLEALMSLGRYADARTLCDALLADAPAAAELLHADAALRYRCEGAAAALAALAEVPARKGMRRSMSCALSSRRRRLATRRRRGARRPARRCVR